jgi:tetratricopeptide (TPR) repeat protein
VVARIEYELGETYAALGRSADAERQFELAAAIGDEALNSPNPMLAETLDSLGMLMLERDDFRRAESLFGRSVAIHESSGAPDPLAYGRSLRHLGNVQQGRQSYDAALAHYEQALPLMREATSAKGTEYGLLLRDLGEIYVEKRQFSLAERTLRESIDVLEGSLPATNIEVLAARTSYETARRNMDSVPASQE